MNLLGTLQKYTTQIMDDPYLSGGQQEHKMIQVFDLCHFIEVYGSSLKIIDYKHKVNVVEDQGMRKGIYFCDLVYNTKYAFDGWLYQQRNVEDIRNQLGIKELWFVCVIESLGPDDLTESKDFIKKNDVESLYDRVLYFNFSQSVIKNIK